MMFPLQRHLILPLAFAVAGGLGGAAAQAAPGLSATNFVDVADSVSQLLDASGLAFSTMMLGAADSAPAPRNASFNVPGTAAIVARPVKLKRACPGGGEVLIDMLDSDGGGDLSVGDKFKLDFKACVLDGDTIGGRSEFVVAGHRFEGSDETTELDFHFDQLGSATMRWTGAARATLHNDLRRGTESYVVSYRDLLVTRGAHVMRWGFRVTMVRPPIGNQLASVRGPMSVDGLALRLNQDEPFVIAIDGHPRSGQLTATDPTGARLEIEAGRRRYAYRLFGAGNRGEAEDASSESEPYGSR